MCEPTRPRNGSSRHAISLRSELSAKQPGTLVAVDQDRKDGPEDEHKTLFASPDALWLAKLTQQQSPLPQILSSRSRNGSELLGLVTQQQRARSQCSFFPGVSLRACFFFRIRVPSRCRSLRLHKACGPSPWRSSRCGLSADFPIEPSMKAGNRMGAQRPRAG